MVQARQEDDGLRRARLYEAACLEYCKAVKYGECWEFASTVGC